MGSKKTGWCLIAGLLFFSYPLFGELLINEVMYAPLDSPEWLELYNEGETPINLTGWNLSDNLNTDQLVCCQKENCSLILNNFSYALLTSQNANLTKLLSTNFLKICVDDNSLGNGLGDNNDTLRIYNNTHQTVPFTYQKELGGYKNNKTLERNQKGEWKESLREGGTPGEKNSVYDFSTDFSALEITEIMADPWENDSALKPLGEWVEIYNAGAEPVYLEGLVLYDKEDSHELYLTRTNTDPLELCSHCYALVYRNGDSDFDLSKVNDKVRLATGYPLSQNTLLGEVAFSNAVEGMSWSKFQDHWYLTQPTPGKENIYTAGCDWAIDIEMNNSLFQGEDFNFKVKVRRNYGWKENITVRGKIEDVFGWLVKEYRPWTGQLVETEQTKTYSPNLKEGIYQLRFWLESLACEEGDLSNNQVLRLIAINPYYQRFDSHLQIEEIYLGNDKQAEWGDQFTAKVNIYKGKETRYSVQFWAEKEGEKISKTTKLNLYEDYKNYSLTLPIQLDANCNQKIKDGSAKLVLEAFDLRTEKEFSVEGIDKEICKDYLDYVKETEKEEKKKRSIAAEILDLPASLEAGQALRVNLRLEGDKKDHQFKAWSYLYRGNKCYSCEGEKPREANQITFKLEKNEVKQIDLLVKADEEIEEGLYSLKVKLNKDNQKTNQELTQSLYIKKKTPQIALNSSSSSLPLLSPSPLSSLSKEEVLLKSARPKALLADEIKGIVVYESSSEKAKNLIPYLLITVLGLFCLVLIFKRI